MTSRDTIYETLTSKTGKKNPATDIERWRAGPTGIRLG